MSSLPVPFETPEAATLRRKKRIQQLASFVNKKGPSDRVAAEEAPVVSDVGPVLVAPVEADAALPDALPPDPGPVSTDALILEQAQAAARTQAEQARAFAQAQALQAQALQAQADAQAQEQAAALAAAQEGATAAGSAAEAAAQAGPAPVTVEQLLADAAKEQGDQEDLQQQQLAQLAASREAKRVENERHAAMELQREQQAELARQPAPDPFAPPLAIEGQLQQALPAPVLEALPAPVLQTLMPSDDDIVMGMLRKHNILDVVETPLQLEQALQSLPVDAQEQLLLLMPPTGKRTRGDIVERLAQQKVDRQRARDESAQKEAEKGAQAEAARLAEATRVQRLEQEAAILEGQERDLAVAEARQASVAQAQAHADLLKKQELTQAQLKSLNKAAEGPPLALEAPESRAGDTEMREFLQITYPGAVDAKLPDAEAVDQFLLEWTKQGTKLRDRADVKLAMAEQKRMQAEARAKSDPSSSPSAAAAAAVGAAAAAAAAGDAAGAAAVPPVVLALPPASSGASQSTLPGLPAAVDTSAQTVLALPPPELPEGSVPKVKGSKRSRGAAPSTDGDTRAAQVPVVVTPAPALDKVALFGIRELDHVTEEIRAGRLTAGSTEAEQRLYARALDAQRARILAMTPNLDT